MLLLYSVFIFNIQDNIKFNPECSIFFNYLFIKSYPFLISFIPLIWFSFNYKINLKNVIPKENISANSGLNSPIP